MRSKNTRLTMPNRGNADSYAKQATARVKAFLHTSKTKGAVLCKTPGMKLRSKGRGRGLARGKGMGPMGIPYGAK